MDVLSGLTLYSMGIVRVDKSRNSDYIDVIPIERLSMLDGDLNGPDQSRVMKGNLPDHSGVIRTSEVTSENYLSAKWIPYGGSNRISSPDVVKGETVLIFTYADTNDYYWTTVFREPSLRRLETVMHGYSDLSGKGTFDKNSSYYMEVSTHDKYIHLHTSKSDGEPYEYDVVLDTENGSLTISDDINNRIVLNSELSTVDIVTNTSVNITTPKVTMNVTELEVNGHSTFNGDVVTNGSVSTSGSSTVGGTSHSTGDISTSGNISAGGTVSGTNI